MEPENLISNNRNAGILAFGPGVQGLRIQGNSMGTDIDGVDALPNGTGVLIDNANRVLVGGATEAARNVISGNGGDGLRILGGAQHVIQGNYIGVGADGSTDLGNFTGVQFFGGTDHHVGGAEVGAGNVISGNFNAVQVHSTAGTIVQGNKIGTNASGTFTVPNFNTGVFVVTSSDTLIGGTESGAGNLISGNAVGIRLDSFATFANRNVQILGNHIGTDVNGSSILGNSIGIDVTTVAEAPIQDVTIGGVETGAGNVISANSVAGIRVISEQVRDLQIQGNKIGTDIDGVDALPNGTGVLIKNASGVLVGGTTTEARNVISGNTESGVYTIGGSDHTIQGNYIGTTADGSQALGNRTGIQLLDSHHNLIGGPSPEARNVVSGNAVAGIQLRGASSDNTIQGNYIGTDSTGTVDLGNEKAGIDIIVDSSRNIIGTDGDGLNDESEGNLISGNEGYGIQLRGLNSGTPATNVIAGNWIGVDAGGNDPLGNRGGILLWGTAATRVGTNADGTGDLAEQNVIAANGDPDVDILNGIAGEFGIYMTQNEDVVIAGNYVGVGADGLTPLGNVADGITLLDSPRTLVGGSVEEAQNVITDNGRYGIALRRSSDSRISGNFIGIAADGVTATGNSTTGVFIADSANVVVGGSSETSRNVISGNGGSAILISGATSTNTAIQGNYIGTDATGSQNIGNGGWNVVIQGAPNNLIGGTTPAAGNVIAGGTGYGVLIHGTAATGNTVQNNLVGTNAAGTVGFSNGMGLSIQDAGGNTVEGNTISGNRDRGVYLSGPTSPGNRFVENYIGVGTDGITPVPNGTGVFVGGASDNEFTRNVVSGNNGNGFAVVGASNTTIQGNLIGTTADGTSDLGNSTTGVTVLGSSGTIIGGETSDARNVISGNDIGGINVHSSTNTTIQFNYIGLNAAGTADVGNTGSGVTVQARSADALIRDNVISGNAARGADIGYGIQAGIASTTILGNIIGLDAAGNVAVPNAGYGVITAGTVGGTTSADRNVISGNGQGGIRAGAGAVIQGNYIGTDVTGLFDRGNGGAGISVEGLGIVIGGPTSIPGTGAGNIVSGNGNSGIVNQVGAANDLIVQGNLIGLGADGLTPVGNEEHGLRIVNASENLIGGPTEGARNVISGNAANGIFIRGGSAHVVQGNYIGTTADGLLALGNGDSGVSIQVTGGATPGGVNNVIDGNVIAANTFTGIYIAPAPGTGHVSSGNLITGNHIGTDTTGTLQRGNGLDGIVIKTVYDNRIGGLTEAERNVIADNGRFGILLEGTAGNLVEGNFVGTTADGRSGLGNNWGIALVNDSFSVVGGTEPGAGNLISDNTIGLHLYGGISVRDAVIQGNRIGTDLDGTEFLSNGVGILIDAATNTLIGGTADGAGNTITGNDGAGVAVRGGTGITIRGNSIHSNAALGIDLGNDGPTPNDDGDATLDPPIPPDEDAGPNDLQNYPVITSANVANATRVAGQLRSTPNSTFIIDFYASTAADPTGFGEGERWLGFIEVTTSDLGVAGFSTEVANAVVDEFISATATNAAGSTSEFSNARLVRGRPVRDGGSRPPFTATDEPADSTSPSLLTLQTEPVASASSQSTSNLLGRTTNQSPATQPATSKEEETNTKPLELELNEAPLTNATANEEPIDLIFADFDGLLSEELLAT